MLVSVCQRWRDQRGSYRLAGEPFSPTAYDVAPIDLDGPARAFVEAHHYSGTYPAARRRFGLYARGGDLVGVAVFSQPMRDEVLRPWSRDAAMELGRLVLLDDVRANGESWFVARCFDALRREGLAGIVSHADPEARTDADGVTVFVGHIGTVYQALGAVYTGRASPRTMRVCADGRELSNRAASKLRNGERGARYATAQLVAAGAREPVDGEDLATWYRAEVARITRAQRHHGNHRYVWALSRGAHRDLTRSAVALPYPKLGMIARAA